ncbi:hypothetical protein D3C86_1454100 [compost metagenome]
MKPGERSLEVKQDPPETPRTVLSLVDVDRKPPGVLVRVGAAVQEPDNARVLLHGARVPKVRELGATALALLNVAAQLRQCQHRATQRHGQHPELPRDERYLVVARH